MNARAPFPGSQKSTQNERKMGAKWPPKWAPNGGANYESKINVQERGRQMGTGTGFTTSLILAPTAKPSEMSAK